LKLKQNRVVDVFAPPPQNEIFETFWEFLQFFICPKNFIFSTAGLWTNRKLGALGQQAHTYVRQEALHQRVLW
jgi:hypothetical protein